MVLTQGHVAIISATVIALLIGGIILNWVIKRRKRRKEPFPTNASDEADDVLGESTEL